MKNLANCKPSEFLKQTNKIKKNVEKWIKDTDLMEIWNRKAIIDPISDEMSEDEKENTEKNNKEIIKREALKKASELFDLILDKNADETLNLLALLCFVEPDEADNYAVKDYLKAVKEMITDEDVIGFFTSLAQLGVLNISN